MNFGEIGASGVIMLVILVFAALGFAKGALKLFYGFLCLVGTLVAGWAGYQFGYPLVLDNWREIPEYGQYVCGIVSGIIAFLLLKTLTDFFSNPFAKDEERKKGSGLLGLLTGFALGFVICLLGMHRLVDKGTRAEVDYWLAHASGVTPDEFPSLAKLKYDFLNSTLGKQVARFITQEESCSQNLAKLAIMQVASPEKLQALAADPAIASTLQSPRLQDFLQDPEVKDSIENGDSAAILKHPSFIALLADPELNHAISQINIEQALKLR
ncbi:MAG: hypothetical protein ABGY95_07965 [Rubritalea sp.]|uniref:hypothetical protein n=1 Tax=Rubritalea sp. TaxID=2109375 RepID=UPI0032426A41